MSRLLTEHEIRVLKDHGCSAEDWTAINVGEDFSPEYIYYVDFYGEVNLGSFTKTIEISRGFYKHSGIRNATLRNCTIGDDCLIENIGSYINNYIIGDDCIISNVSTIETTEGATYGEGNIISVLNEVGEGNVMLFHGLTSQVAALMVKYEKDIEFTQAIRNMVISEIDNKVRDCGFLGDNVKIVNTTEITNSIITDNCEVRGATRIADSTIQSTPDASVFIGSGVICENSIVFDGSSIIDNSRVENCFVGEACKITSGFSAESSLFFANSYMANGEACAAFCGPFSASHHKSSLLIGCEFSFYNAGSATNFSNHAYKMGPMHFGKFERGVKTASGSYILMPAYIGQFSVCFGKIMFHPDTRKLPFSYLMAYGDEMILVPGRTLTTVGLYRDIRKWPRRDKRPLSTRLSIVNFDWLSPFSAGRIMTAKRTLEDLRRVSGDNVQSYNYHDYVIKASSLRKGIKYYDIALRIYMGAVMKRHRLEYPKSEIGKGKWSDLSGLLIPETEEQRIVESIKNGTITSTHQIREELRTAHNNYAEYRWAWSYRLLCEYYEVDEITEEIAAKIHKDYITARRAWIDEIRKDAEREFELGDVDETTYQNFINDLNKEVEFENLKYDM